MLHALDKHDDIIEQHRIILNREIDCKFKCNINICMSVCAAVHIQHCFHPPFPYQRTRRQATYIVFLSFSRLQKFYIKIWVKSSLRGPVLRRGPVKYLDKFYIKIHYTAIKGRQEQNGLIPVLCSLRFKISTVKESIPSSQNEIVSLNAHLFIQQ